MVLILFLTVLSLSSLAVQSSVIVLLNQSVPVGEFTTTRYSDFIGGFDSECSIEAAATLLAPTENPCNPNTIQRSLQGQAVILSFLVNDFGCFEETAYENLERLGAVAILNTDPQPPGASLNTMNWGHTPNTGEIPLLDLGLEFFFGIFLRVAQTGEPVTVSIQGCADDNPYEKCVNVIQQIYNIFVAMVYLVGIRLSLKALMSIVSSPGTAPRLYILRLTFILSTFVAFASLTNLASFDGYFYLSGGIYFMSLRGIFLGLISASMFYMTMLAAYYWSFLENKCFRSREGLGKSGISNFFILNRKKEFFQRYEFKLLGLIWLVCAVTLSILLAQPNADVLKLIQVFTFLDLAVMGGLFFASYTFIAKATQVIKQTGSSGGRMPSPPTLSSRCQEIVDNITGRGIQKYITKNNTGASDAVSFSTMRLTLHLGYWLQVYTLLVLVLLFVAQYLIEEVTSFEKLETDVIMDNCAFVIPAILVFAIRGMMLIPIIQGIKGPSGSNHATDTRPKGPSTALSSKPPLMFRSNLSQVSTFNKESVIKSRTNVSKLRYVNVPDDL